tara:strand:+ start:416 stop:571 length:156 start_codon:yes stop_codon:yes gene_type:complete
MKGDCKNPRNKTHKAVCDAYEKYYGPPKKLSDFITKKKYKPPPKKKQVKKK